MIPIIPDDDVRQKGRNRQKTIFIQKAVENISIAAESAKSAAVCEYRISALELQLIFYQIQSILMDSHFEKCVNQLDGLKMMNPSEQF